MLHLGPTRKCGAEGMTNPQIPSTEKRYNLEVRTSPDSSWAYTNQTHHLFLISSARMSTPALGNLLSSQHTSPRVRLQDTILWERLNTDAARLFSSDVEKFDILLMREGSRGVVTFLQIQVAGALTSSAEVSVFHIDSVDDMTSQLTVRSQTLLVEL
jgi:hypothetical protein